MSTPIPEQFVAAQKAGVESFFGLANKAFGSIEQVTELNFKVAKSTLSENRQLVASPRSPKNPQEWIALPAGLAPPTLEKATSYGRQVGEIASNAYCECCAAVTAQLQQYQHAAQAWMENFSKQMPTTAKPFVNAWKSILPGSAAQEFVQKNEQFPETATAIATSAAGE
jgi:phasin family protein